MGAMTRSLAGLAFLSILLLALLMPWPLSILRAQTLPNDTAEEVSPTARPGAPEADADTRIDVEVTARDPAIEQRISRILKASNWFRGSEVRVVEGIVFLEGWTDEETYREWAGSLARRTEGVVAVVNRIELTPRDFTDLRPALQGLERLWDSFLRSTPLILVSVFLVALAYFLGRAVTWALRKSFRRHGKGDLVRDITARAVGLLLFMFGVYVALRVAGLTRLAATILGGTGVIGLVLGIAFRDIAENVLASILLTRQQPFRKGDLVEIEGIRGLVQSLTIRATVLMSLDGNHVQIPNSTVYKSAIRNFTSNPTRRIDFTVGIGYGDSIARAQEVALAVISEHPAVLRVPEPWVLAETLGSAVVNLRVYVWLDGSKHSWLKVRSSVIRLVKRAFQQEGISMPDEAREVVFPDGVPVLISNSPGEREREEAPKGQRRLEGGGVECVEADTIATGAETGLQNEAEEIDQMATQSRTPEAGADLLNPRAP